VIAGGAVFLIVDIILIIFIVKHCRSSSRGSYAVASTPNGSSVAQDSAAAAALNTAENWSVDLSEIETGSFAGQGSLGVVYRAKWRGLQVAVKAISGVVKPEVLQQEFSALVKVRHPNLVLFMGAATNTRTSSAPPPTSPGAAAGSAGGAAALPGPCTLLVSEWMQNSSLLQCLKDPSMKLSYRRRLQIGLDTAKAMNYLHCSNPAILHKSLSSLSVLLDKDLVAKVSDYGLEHFRKAARTRGALIEQPYWLAPEVIKRSRYTRASDTYAFGVVLWEVMARRPASSGFGVKDPSQVMLLKAISDGERPPLLPHFPPALSALISACWAQDAMRRPSFEVVVGQLTALLARADKEGFDIAMHDPVEVRIAAAADAGAGGALTTQGGQATARPDLGPMPKYSWMVAWKEVQLVRPIGKGTFGEVWEGRFRGNKVAVKKLTSLAVERHREFVQELKMMCDLRHPNVVLFMGACVEPKHACIIMEYCERGSLFEVLHDTSQVIDYKMILRLLLQIAEALVYLHSNRPPILHRDLKSLNVLLDEHWGVKVADFSLTAFKPTPEQLLAQGAGQADPRTQGGASAGADAATPGASPKMSPRTQLSQPGQMGTMFWQAPEVMESKLYTEASDVYSYGMVMWEVFTRKVPFPDMNPHQAALAVVAEDKRPTIPSFVPPGFHKLIEDCWHRSANRRPSFRDVVTRLRKLEQLGLPRTDLGATNARLYKKKATVYAFRSKDVVIVHKPWGIGESKKGDIVVVGPNDDVYTCDYEIFRKTYAPVTTGERNVYKKHQRVWARRCSRDFLMETLEGMEHGSKGDYIAQNPEDGEQWPIAKAVFESMYELDASGAPAPQ
jgi:serine/threonine protein kinase